MLTTPRSAPPAVICPLNELWRPEVQIGCQRRILTHVLPDLALSLAHPYDEHTTASLKRER